MTRSGLTYYYLYDGLGSVVGLMNITAQIVEDYTYDPYGVPSQTSSVANPYFFTGQRYDPESGLYYYKARYYNPKLGRFIQRDPIGFIDNINQYTYTSNNPLNFTDPLGTEKVGEYDVEFHKYDHGDPHWQVFDKHGKTIGRFRPDGSPIEHMGNLPRMPGKVRKWLKKTGKLGIPILILTELGSGKSFAETIGDILDPFSPSDLAGPESDMVDNKESKGSSSK